VSNVGFATLQIIPSAKGFQGALDGQISPAMTRSGKEQGRKFGSVWASTSLGPMRAVAGAAAGLFAVEKIGGFLKDSINQASDLNEAGTALTQIFGSATGTINDFAAKGAKSLGQNRLAVLQAAQTFGVYGKAAGLASGANAKFSTDLAGLSTDLASFYNTSPEEAMQAIAAGLRGEAEPLRRYGVLMNDASLRQEALRMGLIKTTKEALTPQNKVLAAQALIMNQTKVAQGDFARTSGGLANQQRILAAQWTDMKGRVGSALLPALNGAMHGMNGLFAASNTLGSSIGTVLGPAFAGGKKHLAEFVSGMQGTGPAADGLSGKFQLLGAFVRTNVIPAFQQVWSILQTNVIPVFQQVGGFILGTFVPALLSIWASVATRLMPVFAALFTALQAQLLPAIADVYAHFQQWLPTLEAVAMIVLKVVGFLLKMAASILGKVLPPLILLAAFLIGTVVRAIVAVIGVVVRIIGSLISFGSAVGNAIAAAGRFASGVKAKFGEALDYVRGIPGRIKSALGGLGSALLSSGSDLIGGFIRGIENRAGDITSAIRRTITDHLPGFVQKALDIHSPSRVFMRLGEHVSAGMAIGISNGAPKVMRAMEGITTVPDAAYGATANGGRVGGPLVGNLTLQSGGSVRDDLAEVDFYLRRISRGGAPSAR
jgi:hypothetical protein